MSAAELVNQAWADAIRDPWLCGQKDFYKNDLQSPGANAKISGSKIEKTKGNKVCQ